MDRPTADVAGALLGLAVDAAVGDPRHGHPVAAFGRGARLLQDRLERDRRASGVGFWLATVGPVVTAATIAERRSAPAVRAGLTAAALTTTLGGTTLLREARRVQSALRAGDLDRARALLPRLCGREPSHLGPDAITRAVIESVAENTSDAVVGPLLWWAVAGVPGTLGYRAVNTLDAMVGHRSQRYERFGWASARADDVANLSPARVTALLCTLLAPVVGGSPRRVRAVVRSDAPAHPSPNAGVVEAAFAGALEVRLGGPTTYPYGTSERPWLNASGRDPGLDDIGRALCLSRAVQLAAAGAAIALRMAP